MFIFDVLFNISFLWGGRWFLFSQRWVTETPPATLMYWTQYWHSHVIRVCDVIMKSNSDWPPGSRDRWEPAPGANIWSWKFHQPDSVISFQSFCHHRDVLIILINRRNRNMKESRSALKRLISKGGFGWNLIWRTNKTITLVCVVVSCEVMNIKVAERSSTSQSAGVSRTRTVTGSQLTVNTKLHDATSRWNDFISFIFFFLFYVTTADRLGL